MSEKYENIEVLEYKDDKVIQSIKDKELKKRVLSIIDKIFSRKEELWGHIKYLQMVNHGERHTRNVVNLLTRFLVYSQPQLLNELTDMEKFCLIFAVWFHDIGGRGLPGEDKKFLYSVYTRGEHPWVGAKIFKENAPSFGFSEEEEHIISEIIPAHSSKEEIDKLPKEVSVNNQKVRPQLLASILSFMDACDTQQRRVGGEKGVEVALKEIKAKLENEVGKNLEKAKEELEEKKKQYEMLKLQHKQEEVSKLENKIKELENEINSYKLELDSYKEAPKHFYKHLSVKEVYFTPESVILEPYSSIGVVYPERKPFMEYFNLALEDIRKEFERVKKYFNEYGITIREIRAYDEKRDNKKELENQLPKIIEREIFPPTNIPDFYGRKKELDDIYKVITDESRAYSIVNVFGIGGIGKTAFVEVLLLHLSKEYPVVWEVRSTEGRATTFSVPENYKIGTLKFPNIRGLVELLGIEVKENIDDSLINWLDNNKVVLFIDDFQKLESDFKDFINKAYNRLRNGKIIITSRERADVSCHLYKELPELKEEHCKEMIRNELKKNAFEPKKEIVDLIYEKTKGYPLAVKMLVPLISRYKLSFDELRNFGSIRDVQDEKDVKDFISRVFLENVKDERDCNVFKYLSLLKDGFNYGILKAVLIILSDERYEWKDEKLRREFLSQFIPHIISYDNNRKIFNFSNDMIKEAAYSKVENVGEAREKILKVLGEILEEMGKKLSEEKEVFVNEEIFYQAEKIMELKGENKELMKVKFASSYMLANYGYRKSIPLMIHEYGKKALDYAEKLEAWIETLCIAVYILHYAYELLIPEEEARTLYNKVNEVFLKALKLNEDLARYHYAYATRDRAFYVLDSLNNIKEADSALEKAFKEVGSKDSRLIKDELLWYDAYFALLITKSDLLRVRRKLKEALRLLEESEELLEYYKDKIINRWSEKGYFGDKSVIMSRLGILMFVTVESENDLKRVQEYAKNSIIYALKAENRLNAAVGRTNLVTIQMLLAKNQDDFKKANEKVEGINLEDCIKIFEEIGNKHGKASVSSATAIYCLALKRDDDAIKFAKESVEIVKNGPNEYLKAEYELTLAYIKMISRLSDFKKGKLSDEVYELIRDAYERFKKSGTTGQFVVLAVEVVAKYLQNEINYDELLKELDELAKELEIRGDRLRLWIMKQFRESVKKKGDIDEDLLRLEGVKLLLTL